MSESIGLLLWVVGFVALVAVAACGALTFWVGAVAVLL